MSEVGIHSCDRYSSAAEISTLGLPSLYCDSLPLARNRRELDPVVQPGETTRAWVIHSLSHRLAYH